MNTIRFFIMMVDRILSILFGGKIKKGRYNGMLIICFFVFWEGFMVNDML